MGSCGGGGGVFVDEVAEEVAAFDCASGRREGFGGLGWSQWGCAVWSLAVVVGHVSAEGVFEVAAADDEEPVEAFGAYGADEPFRVGVGECRRLRSMPPLSSDLSG